MLKWIVNFLNTIGNLVMALVDLIINAFNAILSLLTHIPDYLNYLGLVMNLVPPFVLSFFLIIISIATVYFIKRLAK